MPAFFIEMPSLFAECHFARRSLIPLTQLFGDFLLVNNFVAKLYIVDMWFINLKIYIFANVFLGAV